MREYQLKNIYQGRLNKGDDIIDALTYYLEQRDIKSGVISGIGAVSAARLGYFNAKTKQYEEKDFAENMEIVSLKGNISIKDNQIFPHIHAIFSRVDFSTVGGHLFHGTLVYAFEFEIMSFDGQQFTREFDEDIGLFLWNR